MKRFFYLILLSFFFTVDIFARAGGGGSGGGNGRAIGIVFTIVFFCLLYYRTRQSKKQILFSGKIDPIWNYNKLCQYANNSFIRMQEVWMKKNLDLVQDLITDNCKEDLSKIIKHMNFVNEKNYVEKIKIKKTKIVGCEDYADNEKDTFIAYFYGSMIDYTIAGLSGNIVNGSKKSRTKFRDLYSFQRHNDIWLIDKINNDVDIKSLYKAKHKIEKVTKT